jgi:hypothetical protein
MESSHEYYKQHGPMTAPLGHARELKRLPTDIATLCQIVQGVLIHRDLAGLCYGVRLSEGRRDEAHLRPISEMLARISRLDARPLTAVREPAVRLSTVCRHFALMLTALLREQGVAARARCGFATYFTPGKFEDHWVCEYWSDSRYRWTLVDAQLDAVQRRVLKVDFDPLDVPRDRFIIAGEAWQRCRARAADPAKFGLSFVLGLAGGWFSAGNVVRDFAALNRVEMLPWDVWGLMPANDAGLSAETGVVLDHIAEATFQVDESLAVLRSLYDSDERLAVPPVVFNALRNRQEALAASA